MPSFLVGVDIGGTFTDCVVLDRDGAITATKSASTPENFAEGMLAAMRMAAERLGLSFEQFCRDVAAEALEGNAETLGGDPHRGEHALGEVARRRGSLGGGDAPGPVEHDAVGEGAADVNADQKPCHFILFPRGEGGMVAYF